MTGAGGDRQVTLVETREVPTAVIAEETSWKLFPARWPVLLDEVWAFVRRTGLAAGRNVMLYRDEAPNVEVGVEAEGAFVPGGRVVASSLPAGLAAHTVARGAPSAEGISAAHAAVLAWCEAEGHPLDGRRWEVYGHWRDDQDPALYEIEVYWLLA
jgi:effector-binding domain-containing protein